MSKSKPSDYMTGSELKSIRESVFGCTQPEMAELLSMAFRTYYRYEGTAYRSRPIPRQLANHVRCKVREKQNG